MSPPGARRLARRLITITCLVATLSHGLFASATAPPDLTGPLSDFWERVKREWSQRLESLNHGPLQTFAWVALVWDGPDDLPIRGVVDDLLQRESKRWQRSQITRHRWSEISHRNPAKMQALRQELLLIGTPKDNQLIEKALAATPLRVEPGAVRIGSRRIVGDDLLLIAVTPSPLNPNHYALVITGSTPAAILSATDVAYGESDFILFRGRKILESGFFNWSGGAPAREGISRSQSFTEHFEWTEQSTAHYRLHGKPARAGPPAAAGAAGAEQLRRLGIAMDADLERTAATYGIDLTGMPPIDFYLYPSADEKLYQTGDARPAHIDRAGDSIHAVLFGDPPDPSLSAAVLLRRAAATWGPRGEIELPGFAQAVRLACRDQFETIPLSAWAARSTRDPGYMAMDYLFTRKATELDAADVENAGPLDAAAFVRDLIEREGASRVGQFYHTALRTDFHERFREIFGESIGKAEGDWLKRVPRSEPPTAGRAKPDEPVARGAARDTSARDHMMQEFRRGEFSRAMDSARLLLAAAPADASVAAAEDRAWARVTLGRIHAIAGRLVAAGAELASAEIRQGPDNVRVLADYWLEKLGQPLNGRARSQMLMQQAGTDLMNWDWEAAEKRLKEVLTADPENRTAHVALGQVYLSRYQYWYDFCLLDRELFPAESTLDPEMYRYFADKGNEELRIAARLPETGGADAQRWLEGADGPATDGMDQAARHFLTGKVSFLKGDLDSARSELQAAISLDTTNQALTAYCHLYLGRIAAATGDTSEARRQFEAAVATRAPGKVTEIARESLKKLEGAP